MANLSRSLSQGNALIFLSPDSGLQFDNMFNVVHDHPNNLTHSSSAVQAPVPFTDPNRHLPASFFNQPPGLQNMSDVPGFGSPAVYRNPGYGYGSPSPGSNYGNPTQGFQSPDPGGYEHVQRNVSTTNLPVIHARSESSPALLQQSLRIAPSPQHSKQGSFDGLLGDFASLHTGWDANGANGIHSIQSAVTERSSHDNKNWSSLSYQNSRDVSPYNRQKVPTQCQQRSSSNHVLDQMQQRSSSNHVLDQMLQVPGGSMPQSSSMLQRVLGALPPNWEQCATPNGDVYYIDHASKRTTWNDPRISSQGKAPSSLKTGSIGSGLQQQTQLPQRTGTESTVTSQHKKLRKRSGGVVSSNGAETNVNGRQIIDEQKIRTELQRLREYKEKLLREQEVIMRNEQHLHGLLSQSKMSMEFARHMTPVTRDPGNIDGSFHPQSSGQEVHIRQNSGDSGLGGMGQTYSLPRTPDNYLNSELMETRERDSNPNAAAAINMDSTPMGDLFTDQDFINLGLSAAVLQQMAAVDDTEFPDDLTSVLLNDMKELDYDVMTALE